jgi:hypothetical protein
MKQPKTAAERPALTDEELLQVAPPRRAPVSLTEDETWRLSVLRDARARALAELRSIGVDVPSVGHLDRYSPHYRNAIPILLKHLLMPYSSVTRESIAHVLAAPGPAVRKAWPIVVEAYKNARRGVGMAAPGTPSRAN